MPFPLNTQTSCYRCKRGTAAEMGAAACVPATLAPTPAESPAPTPAPALSLRPPPCADCIGAAGSGRRGAGDARRLRHSPTGSPLPCRSLASVGAIGSREIYMCAAFAQAPTQLRSTFGHLAVTFFKGNCPAGYKHCGPHAAPGKAVLRFAPLLLARATSEEASAVAAARHGAVVDLRLILPPLAAGTADAASAATATVATTLASIHTSGGRPSSFAASARLPHPLRLSAQTGKLLANLAPGVQVDVAMKARHRCRFCGPQCSFKGRFRLAAFNAVGASEAPDLDVYICRKQLPPTHAPTPAPTRAPTPPPSPLLPPPPPPFGYLACSDCHYTVGVQIATNHAFSPRTIEASTHSGTMFSIWPPLPPALALDKSTGAIRGTPLAPLARRTFTVTSRNGAGRSSTTLEVDIVGASPTTTKHPSTARRSAASAAIPLKLLRSRKRAQALLSQCFRPVVLPARLLRPLSRHGETAAKRQSHCRGLCRSGRFHSAAAAAVACSAHTECTSFLQYRSSARPERYFRLSQFRWWWTRRAASAPRGQAALPPGADAAFARSALCRREAPAFLMYSSASATAVAGRPLSPPLSAMHMGLQSGTSYSIAPVLPPGLMLDRNVGSISGTALAAVKRRKYQVVVRNSFGSTSMQLWLGVRRAPPPTPAPPTPPPRPPTLAYPAANQGLVFVAPGVPLHPLRPVIRHGAPLMFTCTRLGGDDSAGATVPPGLSCDGSTGVIEGTAHIEAAQSARAWDMWRVLVRATLVSGVVASTTVELRAVRDCPRVLPVGPRCIALPPGFPFADPGARALRGRVVAVPAPGTVGAVLNTHRAAVGGQSSNGCPRLRFLGYVCGGAGGGGCLSRPLTGAFTILSQSQNDGRPVYRQPLVDGGHFLFHDNSDGGGSGGVWAVATEIGAHKTAAKLRSGSPTAGALSGEWLMSGPNGPFTIGAYTCCLGPSGDECLTGAVPGMHEVRYELAPGRGGFQACGSAARTVVVRRGVTVKKDELFAQCSRKDLSLVDGGTHTQP
jgi:hypothetical protein